jgi:hAT family C-terminal dimerisation region
MGFRNTLTDKDEFEGYSPNEPTLILDPKTFNPITWWNHSKESFPLLDLYAFDTFAIPAMSVECERVFSSTKNLITFERNRLAEDIIEASECLKNWWDRGLIQQLRND